jgi:hypothetical protein
LITESFPAAAVFAHPESRAPVDYASLMLVTSATAMEAFVVASLNGALVP